MKIKIKRAPKKIDRFDGDHAFLSNFWEEPTVPILMDGCEYTTAEHAYQACKTLEPVERRWIRLCPTPSAAKKMGREVRLRPGWDDVKVGEMRKIVAIKFAPATRLADRLVATGDAELVEGNWWGDRFWGTCGGSGENWLGRLLMEQRAYLRSRDNVMSDVASGKVAPIVGYLQELVDKGRVDEPRPARHKIKIRRAAP